MRADDGRVYANIHSPGNFVMGALYWCAAGIFEKLDVFEAGYLRERVMVDCDGDSVEAFAYVSHPEYVFVGGAPRDEYVQRIVRGGREHGLPEEYIREIESLARSNQVDNLSQ